jgi:Mg2+ and Co2+ transporter CorA
MISLKGAGHKLVKNGSSPVHGNKGFPQSVSLLPIFYGKSLNAKRMSEDSLFALHELFQFWAASEVQFLNVVSSGLQTIELTPSKYPSKMLEVQDSLRFYNDIINRHANSTTDVLQLIETRELLDWPRSQGNKPALMAEQLNRDVRYIFERTNALQEQCTLSMTTLMHQASLQEARNAISQAERVYRLTLLAFIFIPLTFCTSLFGMNFVTFKHSTIGAWTLIAVTLPVLFISLVMFNWDTSAIQRYLTNVKHRGKQAMLKDFSA